MHNIPLNIKWDPKGYIEYDNIFFITNEQMIKCEWINVKSWKIKINYIFWKFQVVFKYFTFKNIYKYLKIAYFCKIKS